MPDDNSQTATVKIVAIDHEGRGIAYDADKTLFIENALLGEELTYKIFKKKKKIFFAKSVDIIKPSSSRINPICENYGICGGCSMQHYEATTQLAYKQKAFEETLKHVGKVKPENLISPIAGPIKAYRHKARFRAKYVQKKERVLIGFNEKLSHFLMDMASCEVIPKKISQLLRPLQDCITSLSIKNQMPQIEYASNQVRHLLVLRILGALSAKDVKILKEFQEKYDIEFWVQTKGIDTVRPLLDKMIDYIDYLNKEFNLVYRFHPTGFTQINPFINEVLIRKAMHLLDPKKNDTIFDFFCGLGNFTLPIATYGSKVTGFEGSLPLVNAAKDNAIRNQLDAKFEQIDLFKIEFNEMQKYGHADKWLIDPPRDGALELVKSLDKKRPKSIVYISCNPATLARDAEVLINEKGYCFVQSGILNMFPHTSHIESISLFKAYEG